MVKLCRSPHGFCAMLAAGLLFLPVLAQAVPSFARQTGLECGSSRSGKLEIANSGHQS
jgi:hypothetical protein